MGARNASILVVDDDPLMRVYVAKILAMRDWQVDTAADGPSSLSLVRQRSYDAAVLDYRLPGTNGAELYRQIRELQPAVRAVFLTGFPTIDTVYPAIEAGGQRVLSKPVDPAELIRAIEEELLSTQTGAAQ
jgi:DNA-binding response OmpR family regulator